MSTRTITSLATCLLLTCILALTGCQKAYYDTVEAVTGKHKRDIMVDRVADARDSQQEAKEEFSSALERFGSVINYDGGTLQEKYEQLNDTFEECEDKAEAVRSRIDKVEDVSEALFTEWEEELTQYTNTNLRNQSKAQLRRTRTEYKKLISAMHKAEQSMTPVLNTLRDQVLFLKHNLNARAIASIKGELTTVKRDVSSLITQMEQAISEANQFIDVMVK